MKTALVTGGGSGIGRELVRLFARQGYQIVVFSLVQDEVDALQSGLERSLCPENIHLFQMDLSQPDAAARLLEVCEVNGLEIDILVNNAGFALWGECVEQDPKKLRSMLQLYIATLTELSQQLGQNMKARKGGKILNIGSTLGVSPVPVAAAYGATKAYVNSFSVALSLELAPYGVQVSVVEPFLTNTNFINYSLQNSPTKLDAQRKDESIAQANKLAHSPERVAQDAYQGLMTGKTIIMPGPLIRLIFLVQPGKIAKVGCKDILQILWERLSINQLVEARGSPQLSRWQMICLQTSLTKPASTPRVENVTLARLGVQALITFKKLPPTRGTTARSSIISGVSDSVKASKVKFYS